MGVISLDFRLVAYASLLFVLFPSRLTGFILALPLDSLMYILPYGASLCESSRLLVFLIGLLCNGLLWVALAHLGYRRGGEKYSVAKNTTETIHAGFWKGVFVFLVTLKGLKARILQAFSKHKAASIVVIALFAVVLAATMRAPENSYLECDKYHGWQRDMCYKTVGVALNDSEVCDRLHGREPSSEKGWCISNVLYSGLTNPRICDKISKPAGEVTKDMCYQLNAERLKDYKLCGKVRLQERRDSCYETVGIALKDHRVCNLIQDGNGRDSCYETVGIALKDPRVCNLIQDGDDRRLCYAITLENLTVLDDLTDNKLKDYYYIMYVYGGHYKNAILCDKIEDQNNKDSCYRQIGVALNNYGICDKIHHQTEKDRCYESVAVALNDYDKCDKIHHQTKKDYCYEMIGITLKNYTMCDKVQTPHTKDECYLKVGIALKDPNMCERITTQDIKNMCYKMQGEV
jgi:hypothetical protein